MIIKRQNRNHTQIQSGLNMIIFQSILYIILRVPLIRSFSLFLSSVVGNILLTFVFTFGQEFDLVAVELQPTSYLTAALIKPAMHSSSLVAHR